MKMENVEPLLKSHGVSRHSAGMCNSLTLGELVYSLLAPVPISGIQADLRDTADQHSEASHTIFWFPSAY